MKRSGNVLPSPINELSCTSFTSTESSTIQSTGATSDIVNHNSYMAHVIPYSDKDEDAGDPNRTSTSVDVGVCNSSGAEKDGDCSEDSRISNLCSNLSPVTTNKDNHAQEPYSDTLPFEVPSSNHHVNHLPRVQNSIEISDEPLREDSVSFDDQQLKDSNSFSQRAFLIPSYSANCTGDSGGHSLMHRRTCCLSNNGMEHRSLHNEVEEVSSPLSIVNSTLIDGLHDLKFQSSVKSDTIYRGSNSFSNEEIVEHLRRAENDCLNNYDESSASSPGKNSIISNIFAVDFGSRDNSLTLHHSLSGLCNEPNGQHDSWKSLENGQGFSFMKQDGSSSQRADLDSSSWNISVISSSHQSFTTSEKRKSSLFLTLNIRSQDQKVWHHLGSQYPLGTCLLISHYLMKLVDSPVPSLEVNQ